MLKRWLSIRDLCSEECIIGKLVSGSSQPCRVEECFWDSKAMFVDWLGDLHYV